MNRILRFILLVSFFINRAFAAADWRFPLPPSATEDRLEFKIGDIEFIRWTTDYETYDIEIRHHDIQDEDIVIFSKRVSSSLPTENLYWVAQAYNYDLKSDLPFYFAIVHNFSDSSKDPEVTVSRNFTISSTSDNINSINGQPQPTVTVTATPTACQSQDEQYRELLAAADRNMDMCKIKIGVLGGLAGLFAIVFAISLILTSKYRRGSRRARALSQSSDIPSPNGAQLQGGYFANVAVANSVNHGGRYHGGSIGSAISPGMIPGASPGFSPGVSPGRSPEISSGFSPGNSPGFSPHNSPGISPGSGPGMSQGFILGHSPGNSPGERSSQVRSNGRSSCDENGGQSNTSSMYFTNTHDRVPHHRTANMESIMTQFPKEHDSSTNRHELV